MGANFVQAMAFLKRSKSQKAKEVKELTPLPALPEREVPRQPEPEPVDIEARKERRKSRFERRKSIFGRSKSANDARKSIQVERPRTANQAAPSPFGERRDLHAIGETIAIQSGGDTFNFPTPSPRLPPPSRDRSSTFQGTASPLAQPQSPPPIGVALGSPTQAPPAWGRSYTADEINARMGRAVAPKARQQAIIPEEQLAEPEALPSFPELRKKESRWKTLGGLFRTEGTKACGHGTLLQGAAAFASAAAAAMGCTSTSHSSDVLSADRSTTCRDAIALAGHDSQSWIDLFASFAHAIGTSRDGEVRGQSRSGQALVHAEH